MNISFPQIKDIAHRGVRRAAVFLGLGINAAESPELKDHNLAHHSFMRFVPEKVDAPELAAWKKEFGFWIVECGLRELMETFALFLDKIHEACLLMAISKGQIEGHDAQEFDRSFRRKGIKDKLPALRNRFAVTCEHPDELISINQARNCLTHRSGVVRADDFNDGDRLSVGWHALEISVADPEGEKVVLGVPLSKPVPVKKGAIVAANFARKSVSFSEGAPVKFTPMELHEICLFVYSSTNEITSCAEQYARKLGIPLNPVRLGACDQ